MWQGDKHYSLPLCDLCTEKIRPEDARIKTDVEFSNEFGEWPSKHDSTHKGHICSECASYAELPTGDPLMRLTYHFSANQLVMVEAIAAGGTEWWKAGPETAPDELVSMGLQLGETLSPINRHGEPTT